MTVRVGRLISGMTAEDHRLAAQLGMSTTGALQTRSGLVAGTTSAGDLTAVSAMVGRISPCQAWIDGTSATNQSAYPVTVDANVDLTFANGDATSPRLDMVIIRVKDNPYDASGAQAGSVEIVQGTPAASPVLPATPASSLALWQVRVEAGVNVGNGGINFATKRTDLRTYTVALGGILIGTTGNGIYAGQYRYNAGALEYWNGAAWTAAFTAGYSQAFAPVYAQNAAITTGISPGTTVDVCTAAAVNVPSGAVRITIAWAGIYPTTAVSGQRIELQVKEGVTLWRKCYSDLSQAIANRIYGGGSYAFEMTPTVGSHTYKFSVMGWASNSATFELEGGADHPNSIRVEPAI